MRLGEEQSGTDQVQSGTCSRIVSNFAGDCIWICLYFLSSVNKSCCCLGGNHPLSSFIYVDILPSIFFAKNELLLVSGRPNHALVYFCSSVDAVVGQGRRAVARYAIWNRAIEKWPAARVVNSGTYFPRIFIF